MKKHLIRSQRPAKMLVPNYPVTVYRTWCNWQTVDKRAIADSAHVPTADMCKRCTAEVAKLNRDSHLVPIDGE